MGNYDDIIHLPHPVSTRHARMSRLDRAAQFSPFAALTGFDATIAETVRQPDESWKEALNERLRRVLSEISRQPRVRITYFREDDRKTGGAYVRVSGRVKKVDAYDHTIILTDGQVIPLETMRDLEVEE